MKAKIITFLLSSVAVAACGSGADDASITEHCVLQGYEDSVCACATKAIAGSFDEQDRKLLGLYYAAVVGGHQATLAGDQSRAARYGTDFDDAARRELGLEGEELSGALFEAGMAESAARASCL